MPEMIKIATLTKSIRHPPGIPWESTAEIWPHSPDYFNSSRCLGIFSFYHKIRFTGNLGKTNKQYSCVSVVNVFLVDAGIFIIESQWGTRESYSTSNRFAELLYKSCKSLGKLNNQTVYCSWVFCQHGEFRRMSAWVDFVFMAK